MAVDSQYRLIRLTREIMFNYCAAIPLEDYIKPMESFTGSSMQTLHLHVAECYHIWIGRVGLGLKDVAPIPLEGAVEETRRYFAQADDLVQRFIRKHDDAWDTRISAAVAWQSTPLTVTPLWLMTHTITHEFHHKGQIVNIGRQLGYVPPDTDVIVEKL